MKFSIFSLICLISLVYSQGTDNSLHFLGEFPSLAHGVSGQVWADLSDHELKTVRIKNLNYDGTAPDAYFWAGTTDSPDTTGFIIPDERGSTKPLKAYRNADIVLKLPQGKSLLDIKWLSIWCRRYRINFGNIVLQ